MLKLGSWTSRILCRVGGGGGGDDVGEMPPPPKSVSYVQCWFFLQTDVKELVGLTVL